MYYDQDLTKIQMGRHRTSRAKDKRIRDPKRKFSNKRNRDIKLKEKRKNYQKSITLKAKANQAFLENAYPTLYKQQKQSNDMERIKKEISQKYIERVTNAQTTYDSLINTVDNTQGLIEILDARDPFSFRFLDIEGETTSENKPLIFLINKIDLVPAEDVKKWISALSQTAPTIAVSLLNPESCADLINHTLAEVAPESEKIAVVGAPGVGKTTLCKLIGGKLVDTEKWLWTICGNSLGLTNSVPWRGRIREFAVDTFERMTNDLIYQLLGMDKSKESSVGNLFADYGKKNGLSKQEVPEFLMNKFTENEWKWFAEAPINETEVEINELQAGALAACSKADESEYITLGEGVTVQMDKKALQFELPEPGSSDEQDDDVEEEEEEENAENDN